MAIIQGANSGNLAEVDSSNQLRTVQPSTAAGAGFTRIADGNGNPILTTEDGALSTSFSSLILYDQVDGNSINTNIWNTTVSNMTMGQLGGFIILNSGSITTASSYSILSSIKAIPLYSWLPIRFTFNAKVNVQPQGNLTIELGLGSANGTSIPTDFVGFRWNSAGAFQAVINNAGVETTASISGASIPINNDVVLFDIVVVEAGANFYINDELVANIDIPIANAYPTSAGRQPVFARVYTSGSPPASAPVLSIGQITVVQDDVSQNKSWPDTLAGIGRGAYQSPVSPFTQNSNHTNSASPSNAALSNTGAGYTTLGGRYQFGTPTGSATDYALFAFQVPSGYQLFVQNIRISAMNTGSTVVTTPTILDWSLGMNSSALSLATLDNPPTGWAPRRVPIGMQSFVTGIGNGGVATDINLSVLTPFIVDGGRYLHTILQVPVATATANQFIRGDVFIQGYFE